MVLQAITGMFTGAARAAGKGLQNIFLLFSPARQAASAASKKIVSKLGPTARMSLQAISKQVRPGLKQGLRYAKNVNKQSVKTLGKKANLSQRVFRKSRRFWKWGNRRMNQLKTRMQELQKRNLADPQEAALVQDEFNTLKTEQRAFEHLEADEQNIKNEFKKTRNHDLKPLLKKANHAAKLAKLEDGMGAIDPAVLEEYSKVEGDLLKKINEEEAFEQKVEQDEFEMMKVLLSSLMRENQDLKQQLQRQNQKKQQQQTKRRMNQALAEIYMLQHALQLAENERINEEILRKRALKIYALVEWLKKVGASEQAVIEGKVA